jgi:hypothetical protein
MAAQAMEAERAQRVAQRQQQLRAWDDEERDECLQRKQLAIRLAEAERARRMSAQPQAHKDLVEPPPITLPDDAVVLTFPDGRRYEGQVMAENARLPFFMPHGKGVEVDPAGSRYDGQWQNGLYHGHGVVQNVDGSRYEGYFVAGQRHGQGSYRFADRSIYVGAWEHGEPHGRGKWTYTDGSTHDGMWKHGNKHGKGVMTDATGVPFAGVWLDDEPVPGAKEGDAMDKAPTIEDDMLLVKRLYYDPVHGLAQSAANIYIAVLWRRFAVDQENLLMTRDEFLYCYKVMALTYNTTSEGIEAPMPIDDIDAAAQDTWREMVSPDEVATMTLDMFYAVYCKTHTALNLTDIRSILQSTWGALTFSDNRRFEGVVHAGLPYLLGTEVFPGATERRYVGEYKEGSTLPHGWGTFMFAGPDGNRSYEGQIHQGEPSGHGTWAGPDLDDPSMECRYTSQVVQAAHNGNPGLYVFVYGPQHRYEGEAVCGVPHGVGTEVHNGVTYTGHWKNGKFDGEGEVVNPDSSVYRGQFVAGQRHGQGTYRFVDCGVYSGSWKKGQPNGRGMWTYPDKSVYVGEWKAGVRHGLGTLTEADGYDYSLLMSRCSCQ